ncbi:MAG: hypothetical protein GX875_00645 [Propionibacterium sp.]|nr:hypothetical protein [Propionibacterium sp.]
MVDKNEPESSGSDAAVTRIRTAKLLAPKPERPSVLSPNSAPVLVKLPPPFSARACQLMWIVSFILAVIAIVFFFVVREDQLPFIVETIQGVEPDRPDETYDKAADIIYWSVFAAMIALVLAQVTLLVSFMNRKPGVRWWQFFTLLLQALFFGLGRELVTGGDHGEQLQQLLAGQLIAVILALLLSNLPSALAWSARRHDVRKIFPGSGGPES